MQIIESHTKYGFAANHIHLQLYAKKPWMVLLINFKIKSQILLGRVSGSILFIRNNEQPRAECHRSITLYSQNILSKHNFKTTCIKRIKH